MHPLGEKDLFLLLLLVSLFFSDLVNFDSSALSAFNAAKLNTTLAFNGFTSYGLYQAGTSVHGFCD